MTLTPAYGRDYKSAAEVLAHFRANKDFIVATTGQTCSLSCVKAGERLSFRYNGLRSQYLYTVRQEDVDVIER